MAGVKGRSGRHPRYVERNQEAFLKDNEFQLQRILNDPNSPPEWKRNARLAIYLKGMTNKQESSITLIPAQQQAILDRYIKPLPNNRLELITGNTASSYNNNINNNGDVGNNEDVGKSECGDGGGEGSPGVPPSSPEISKKEV